MSTRSLTAALAVVTALALSGCSPILGLIVRATQSRGGTIALDVTVHGVTAGAGDQFAPDCGSDSGPDAVYVFIPETTGTYRAEVNADYDSVLALYDSERTSLACNDDTGATTRSVVEHRLEAGQAYSFVVDGYRGATGTFDLTLTTVTLEGVVVEPGDHPTLTLDTRVAADTTGGPDTRTPTCGGTPDSPDRTFNFTAPAAGRYVFDVDATYDAVLAVYSPGARSPIVCNDDHGNTQASRVALDLTAGQVVEVLVDGYHGASGAFGLIARSATVEVQGALVVGTPVAGDTNEGTDAHSGECGSAVGTPDQSWDLTVPRAGRYRIRVASNYDATVSLYDADTGDLVVCNNNAGNTRRSEIVPQLRAGARYHVVVDGYSNNRGTYRLSVSPAPSRQLRVSPGWTRGDTRRARIDAVTPSCGARQGSPDEGWLFTAPSAGVYRADVQADFNAVLMVENDAGVELACNDDHQGETNRSHVEFAMTEGQVVRVVVDGHQGASGPYQVQVGPQGTEPPRPPPPVATVGVENITAMETRCAAAPLLTTGTLQGHIDAATADVRTTCGGGGGGAEFLYRVEVTQPMQLMVSVVSDTYPILELREGCSTGSTVVTCGGPTRRQRRAAVSARLTPGQTYTLVVDSRGVGETDFTLSVSMNAIAAP